ncbi:hypothetical protein [Hymenobacter koreensis]|uniref:Uncharacterized protein n=1 Tax=Hymenobacter koreensis TaxID=1084523 RepID=A0ABP8JBN8_9BACT
MFQALVARTRDLLQLRFSPLYVSLPAAVLDPVSPANPLRRLVKVLGYAGARLVGNAFRPIRNSEKLHGAVWLYVVSQNNVEALQFLRDQRIDAVLVAGQSKQIGRYNHVVNRLSLRRKLLYYWQFPFVLAGLLRREGAPAWRFFDLIFNAIGYYEIYRRALRHYRPRAVVFANDHNDDARALLLACQAENIPTAYVQHASVSTIFPPLGFNLNLLEGQDALDKYAQCGAISGEVRLVGMPKADAYLFQRNTELHVRRVGIAANLLDPTAGIQEAVTELLSTFPDLTFTLRPHPGDQRDFASLRQRFPQLRFSSAREESVFAFLLKQDALIAADTSTHLEATLLNLVSIYYRFGAQTAADDYYGYVANGLIDRANTPAELQSLLHKYTQHKPPVLYQRAGYYCATIGTAHEGNSQKLALRYVNEWLTSA